MKYAIVSEFMFWMLWPMGVVFGWSTASMYTGYMKEKGACELSLPRDQECVMYFKPMEIIE